MPTQIQIKRGTSTPSGLTVGEKAVNTSTNQIYMGGTGGTVWVGGVVTGGVDMGAGSALSATQIPTQSGVYNYARNNFVSSFNGSTGAVGGVCAASANTFTALQSFNSGISANGGTFSVQLNAMNLRMLTQGGDEGGQIDFSLPATNTTLSSGVAIDIYQNRVRIFETGGTNRGAYIDLTSASTGVGSNLLGGGAVSSVSGSGNGISVSPTTGAVVVQNTGVHSFNGLTGAVGGVCAAQANTFTAVQTFNSGISAGLGVTFSRDIRVNGIVVGLGRTGEISNLAVGASALASLISGNSNVAIGSNVMSDGTYFSNSVAIGANSQKNNTGNGIGNITVGSLAMQNYNTASSNIGIGSSVLFAANDALYNVAVGANAMNNGYNASYNIAVGSNALQGNSDGGNNTAIGYNSLYTNDASNDNTAVGYLALEKVYWGSGFTSDQNVALGSGAGRYRGTGTGAIANRLNSANRSIFIGYRSRAAADSQENQIVIGTDVVGGGSNTTTIGSTYTTNTYLYGRVDAIGGVSAPGGTFTGNIYSNTAAIQTITSDFINGSAGLMYINDGASTSTNIGDVSENGNGIWLSVSDSFNSITSSIGYGSLNINTLGTSSIAYSLGGGLTLGNSRLIVNGGLASFNSGISASGGVTFGGPVASDTGYRITSTAVNAQTGTTYTFLSSDNGKIITFNNGSAVTVTIPTALPVGFNCTAIQLGTGQVGFTAASGVTLNSYGGFLKMSGQHGAASIIEYSTNVCNISGTLST